jgi:hypothetical protein
MEQPTPAQRPPTIPEWAKALQDLSASIVSNLEGEEVNLNTTMMELQEMTHLVLNFSISVASTLGYISCIKQAAAHAVAPATKTTGTVQ